MQSSTTTRVAMLAVRHAESTFIKWFEENKPLLEENKASMSAFDREHFYH